jgi:hypothetical protein
MTSLSVLMVEMCAIGVDAYALRMFVGANLNAVSRLFGRLQV